MQKSKLTVLIVEDEPNDVSLLKRAFKKIGVEASRIFTVQDGEDAINYLLAKDPFDDREKFPYPDVVLTDLKMPRKNGFELLMWLRDNPIYQVIPTIVFSSSRDERDVRQAYYLGANSYMVKPHTTQELESLMTLAIDYWKRCELPT